MPGVGGAAGVKTSADINSQPRQPGKLGQNLRNPATWSYIWVGGAALYLFVTYMGIFRVSRLAK